MKKNPISLAVICENKQQREHALQVAQKAGIAFGEWHCKTDEGNILRVYEGSGDWHFLEDNSHAKNVLTYDYFIAQYGNNEQPQPDPIAELIKRLEALEARVFGNSEWPTVEEIIDGAKDTRVPITELQPEAIYEGVFWFEHLGRTRCVNGQHVLYYSNSYQTWLIWGSKDLPKHRHRLVPVEEFTVGKWYACEGEDLNTPIGYSMYLGHDRFITWCAHDDIPIETHESDDNYVQLLEVQPA